jgi:VirE N-terminal domain/Primase C terminal 2 (PriCT-2)
MTTNPFSYFEGGILKTIPTKEIGILDYWTLIKSDKNKSIITQLRQETNPELQSKIKSKLNYCIPSGIFKSRKAVDLVKHSNIICLDYDGLENMFETKSKFIADKYVLLCFISPRGNGLKVFVEIETENNREAWLQLNQYFYEKIGLNADKSGKDVCRACFDSYDPEAFLNEKNIIFQMELPVAVKQIPSKPSDFEKVKSIVEKFVEKGIDITMVYQDWVNTGFALATLGEAGRELYYALSKVNSNYNDEESNKKFNECLKNGHFTNAAFLFAKAKEYDLLPKKEIIKQEFSVKESNGEVRYNKDKFKIQIATSKTITTITEGFLVFIKYQTIDENNQITWILEIKTKAQKSIFIEVSHDDFFEPKSLEKILGAHRLSITVNYQQLQKLRTHLFNYTEFPKAMKVLRYGMHPESELYFFANCAVTKKGEILYPDKFSIIQYNNRYLSVPQVNKGQSSPFKYVDNQSKFNDWYLLFAKAQREEITFLSASFMLFSIFRDIAIDENNFSPMLYIYGIAGTAKSTIFTHMNYVFGADGKAMSINLKGRNTEPAFLSKMEQRYNGFQFGDEYKPNHVLTPLFQATYDNKGYSKMKMDHSSSSFDTIDLVPKCTLAFASNFLPELPNDEPFFSRLVVLINNNRNRTETQKQAYRELLKMQESGITNILREIWQYRDLIKKDFKKTYHLLKKGLENHFAEQKVGNDRYIYNIAQILTVPFILSLNGKIAICEATTQEDLLAEFVNRSIGSINNSDRLVQEKTALQEFFCCVQELYEKAQIFETVHFRFDKQDIVINLHRLYQKFSFEFKRQNRFEIQPPSIQTIQDEILMLVGLDQQSEEVKNVFFKKQRFLNEDSRIKTDYARNAFRVEYELLRNKFEVNFSK